MHLANKMLELLDKKIKFDLLREDNRKLGINLITAGTIGVFITNITNEHIITLIGCAWVSFLGILLCYFGVRKRSHDNE